MTTHGSAFPAAPGIAADGVRSLARTVGRHTPAAADGTPRIVTGVPRPRLNWKTRVLLPAVLLAGFGLALAYAAGDSLVPATPVRVVPVMLASTAGGERPAVATVQAPGWVEPDPYPVAVTSLTDGVVKEVGVLEGHEVKAGQVVARLVDDDARLGLAKAEAEWAFRRATLAAAQAAWDNPVERTRAVAATRAKAAEARAAMTMLESEVSAEQARAEELRYENQRVQQAFAEKAAAPLEAVLARQRLAAQEATLEATRRKQAVLEQQHAQHEAELAAATDNQRLRIEEAKALAEAKAAADLAAAARDEARLRLTRTEVRSPADGVVLARLVEPGSKLMIGMDDRYSATVARLYDPRRLQVRVDVPLADAAKVSVGQQAEVVVAVLPDRTFKGRVTRAVHEADLQKNTQQFKVQIDGPAGQIKPEMLARVKFLAAAPAGTTQPATATAVFAPASLLKRQGESDAATALVVDTKRSVAVARTLRLGPTRKGGWVQVDTGLLPGDALIAEPSDLSDGQKVKVAGEASVTDSALGTEHSALPRKEAGHGVH